MSKAHNLNIHMYKFDEILDLFGLTYDISIDDMKRAKKTVLMTHPDKSKLGPEYFLFYKKAFDMVYQFYENQQKVNAQVPTEEEKYKPFNQSAFDKSTNQNIKTKINKMTSNEFQHKFNQLFEENMSTKPDPTRNEWFTKDDATFKIDETVTKNNMGQVFEKVKTQQASMGLTNYRGVENLYVNSGTGSKLYDETDSDNQYVECDPFSKLKFDDLRKVHKDQTVLSVSESDYRNVPKFSSVDQYSRERNKQTLTPIEKQDAERMLSLQEKNYKEAIMRKEYEANLKSYQYAEKNKAILSNFLHLGN
jgi:hypothetical protein